MTRSKTLMFTIRRIANEPITIMIRPTMISLWPAEEKNSGDMYLWLIAVSSMARKIGSAISTYAEARPMAVSALILRAND